MRIRLNSFIEEMVRRVDHVICRKRPSLAVVPVSQRMLIVARILADTRVADREVGPDGIEVWTPCANLEQKMIDSNITKPIEFDVPFECSDRRSVMLYVAAARDAAATAEILKPAIEAAVSNVVSYHKGYVQLEGWDKNGMRKWKQTSLGRREDPIW
jgi:hypothetical protein